jgi:D-sedoheptulose 7-phosphate isomerase
MATFQETIRKGLNESAAIKIDMARTSIGIIERIARQVIKSLKNGGKLVVFGNGGSAGDASHLATELVGRFHRMRRPLPALALNADDVLLTCIGNDFGYDQVFSRQVEALVEKRDTVIAISTSGRSPNVIRALKAANRKGAFTIGFTGGKPCALSRGAKLSLRINATSSARIQEGYMTAIHIICQLIDEEFSPASK